MSSSDHALWVLAAGDTGSLPGTAEFRVATEVVVQPDGPLGSSATVISTLELRPIYIGRRRRPTTPST